MQDTARRVRQQAIHDIWVDLGRDPQSTTETVWPDQFEMRLPVPFEYVEEGVTLSDVAEETVELLQAHYLRDVPDGGPLRSVAALDLGDGFFYIVEFGDAEPILWAVTPLSESRDTFAEVQRRWVERRMGPPSVPFPTEFRALSRDEPWFIRLLTETLMERGPAGLEEIWDILNDNRELDATDPDAVTAFWRMSVDHGPAGPRTGPVPGLTHDTLESPEFNQWIETAELRWRDTQEPITYYTALALRAICFYIAAPMAYFEGR